MPRIPTYTAQRTLDTDRGGMPRVQANDHVGRALQGLGRTIASLPRRETEKDRDGNTPQHRREQRQHAHESFGIVRTVLDAQTALKKGLIARRKTIEPDGTGFYETYNKEVVEPELAKAVAAFPPEEQPAVRDMILARAEPVLQRAAETERNQSIGFYEAETVRLAAGILDDVDLTMESFVNAREELGELLGLSVLPTDHVRNLAKQFDKELAWTAASRIAGMDPERLMDGMLGTRFVADDTGTDIGGEGGPSPLTRPRAIARLLTGGDEAARVIERFMLKAFGQLDTATQAGDMTLATAAYLDPDLAYRLGGWATATAKPRRGDLVLLPEGGIGLFDRPADGDRSLVLVADGDGAPALQTHDRQVLEFRRVRKVPLDELAQMARAARAAFGLQESVAITEPDPRFAALSLAERLTLLAELDKRLNGSPAVDSSADEPDRNAGAADDGWKDIENGMRIRRKD